MPLQNRVDPFGAIIRTPARGTMMGNRGGALHNESQQIVRQYKDRRWITCVLEFRGRRRVVMSPRRYTELFFLDEAVAFAAGHRPCAECRRERFLAFKDAWARRTNSDPRSLRAGGIDVEMQAARIGRRGSKVTYRSVLGSLPNGCFVEVGGAAWLVWDDHLHLWTPEGYARKDGRPHDLEVAVLTPRPVVECFDRGYAPNVHQSAIIRK